MDEKRLPDLRARMRRRRLQLGLTGTGLAQRAGISPSYVSLIETGAKVPEEDVAAGLARALDDVGGQAVVFFVLVVAAAEVVVGLGIIVAILRRRQGATADDISLMRG